MTESKAITLDKDGQFINRSDAHINLSNQQAQLFGIRPTTESMVYAASRFSAWCLASTCKSRAEMAARTAAEVEAFTQMYREMLEENMQAHMDRLPEVPRF